ncbi:UNVERIFIED_CONTAM: hypothetical protein Scaly_2851000 [Sesamum calycinum]|uniref:Uncharacterized protein n=1 Tax=Sesamum calycinum TaxID=2727403 RepID=A0AAW2LGH3_9LAMI
MDVLTHASLKDETFMMRVVLMWIVNDLSAYRMTSGWSIAGVMGCSVCMEDTRAFYLQNSKKAYYFDYHRQFLLMEHPYRRNKKSFTKNRILRKVARPRLTGEQIHGWIEEFSVAVEVKEADWSIAKNQKMIKQCE